MSEVAQSCRTLCDPMDYSLTRFLHPWDLSGKKTGVGCHFLLQEIFLTQGLNPGLPHCRQTLYRLSHQGRWCVYICMYVYVYVYIYIYGILLRHKEEWNYAICRDMDGPRDCHTDWSKSEKQILYINIYMWNLEKWYQWASLQSRNRATDVENKCMDTKWGRERWDGLGDWDCHKYVTMYKIDN